MSKLFESSEINGMKLANRFVRSATWEGMASPEGAVTPKLIETMRTLAKGGVGLIISSHAYVRPDGQASPWQIGVYKDELIPGLKEMAAAVHEEGGRIVMQLAHAGHFAAEKLTGQTPLVVSNYEGLAKTPRKEVTLQDIKEITAAFAEASRRAKAAVEDARASAAFPTARRARATMVKAVTRRSAAPKGSASATARVASIVAATTSPAASNARAR